jgi:hypothetical protein
MSYKVINKKAMEIALDENLAAAHVGLGKCNWY